MSLSYDNFYMSHGANMSLSYDNFYMSHGTIISLSLDVVVHGMVQTCQCRRTQYDMFHGAKDVTVVGRSMTCHKVRKGNCRRTM